MSYKIHNIIKNSFMAISLAYLLSSTAMAQNTLALMDENAPMVEPADAAPADMAVEDNPLSVQADGNLLQPVENQEGDELKADLDVGSGEETEFQPINTPNTGLPEGTLSDEPNNEDPFSAKSIENDPSIETDPAVAAYNNYVDESDKEAFNANVAGNDNSTFGDKIMDQVKEDLFSQMADIEKQTSLLTLELKREKIKNEIAAMHAQRQKALDEEKEKQREKERKQAEWEKEQERKLLEDQQKLKKLEIKFEKLRQERVLKAYKDSMLKSNQEWVDYNARLYNQLVKEETAQNDLIAKYKEYFKNLAEKVTKVNTEAQKTKEKYNQEIANLQTQVAILKSKLEAEKTAFEESKKTGPNPFALVDEENAPTVKVAEEYAIMEISGKGDKLSAKLINKNGGTFMVKPGTVLNTGHIIEEITQTYIVTDKGGIKDYLYFSAGGILDKEPSESINVAPVISGVENVSKPAVNLSKIPNLRSGMFVE